MAKIYEEAIVIKLSKLVKNHGDTTTMINDDLLAALEQVAQELVGKEILVEVETA